jgi:hypothetical protein
MSEEKASTAEDPPKAATVISAISAGYDLPAEMLDSAVPYDFDAPGGCG